ncbi:MAG: dihydroorotate dehydrogenase-like protein [Bacteroidales bacterium]|jgi:dihydroorotate dehydrogenase (fumarate)|nr:dihydroorotate dehydrogenase-like protein [Bacteroidales bacterium]
MDLSTKYLGLELPTPVIVGSSGLTDTAKKIEELEKYGAGAVVIKSIFEEEITMEYEKVLAEEAPSRYKDDYLDYFDYKIKEQNLGNYIKLITEAKKKVKIPVIASINCTSSHEWTFFARKIEEAGADAIELNIFELPSTLDKSLEEIDHDYLEIINDVKNTIKIPLAIKISYYFSNLGRAVRVLSKTGVSGIVMFNRFFSPDIDLDKMEIVSTNVFSTPQELPTSLRWIGIMANRVKCDLAASTGVHDGKAVVKQLLAGANAVQMVSALYEKGPEYLKTVIEEIEAWMKEKGYEKIDDFRGMLSQEKYVNPALYERVQFMKYFSDREKYQ